MGMLGSLVRASRRHLSAGWKPRGARWV